MPGIFLRLQSLELNTVESLIGRYILRKNVYGVVGCLHRTYIALSICK